VRRAIAGLGTVPAETIRADDTFSEDLVQLPFWDSLEWMGLILEIEQQPEDRVSLPECVIEDAIGLAGRRPSELQVKHVARAAALAATSHPTEAVRDGNR